MGKRYRGNFFAQPKNELMAPKDVYFEIRVTKEQISFLNKLIEAYDHMAFVIQVNPSQGVLGLFTTRDQELDLTKILKNLPFEVEFIEAAD